MDASGVVQAPWTKKSTSTNGAMTTQTQGKPNRRQVSSGPQLNAFVRLRLLILREPEGQGLSSHHAAPIYHPTRW
jgi:hypothetical protein